MTSQVWFGQRLSWIKGLVWGLLGLALLAGIGGCGGTGASQQPPPPPPPPSISVSPSAVTVSAGGTQQFQAVVSNATNTSVTWKVNGIEGGNAAAGTISSGGLYLAPSKLTTPAQATITAVLQADTSKSASATVSIPAIGVNISPGGGVVEVGTTVQYSASVTNSVDQTVTWQVNGIAGGNSSAGTISASGLYTAPASVPGATTITVSAISVADTSKSGSTQASVVPVITIAISPASVTMPAGSTQQFTATVQGTTSNASVTWDIPDACDQDGDCTAELGSIDNNGLYSAPPYPPRGSHRVTISVTSNVNPSKIAFAQVTVNYSNASLGDSYAFFLRGRNAVGDLLIAGSFSSDGNGNLTQGVEDIVNRPNPVVTNLSFTGHYSIEPDGRGTATFSSSHGTSTLRFLLVDGAGLCCSVAIGARVAQVIEFDSLAVAEGSIERQFGSSGLFHGVGNSADFAFGLSGSGPSGKIVAAGRFTSSAGIGEGGPISGGLEDVNNSGTVATSESFTGSYDENTFSRGKLTLSGPFGTRNFAYYAGDASIFVIGLDPDFSVLGTMQRLFTLDFPSPLSKSLLNSKFVIERAGVTAGVPLVSLGQFNADGVGGISAGIADENAGGVVSEDVSFSGNYSLAATGRGAVTLTQATGDVHLSFYAAGLSGSITAFFIQTDTTGVTGGRFNTASAPNRLLTGQFGLVFTDSLPAQRTALGLVQANAGQFQGKADTNDSGGTLSGVDVSGTSTWAQDARGLVTVNTPTRSLRFRAYSWLSTFRPESRLVGLDSAEQQLGVLRPQE